MTDWIEWDGSNGGHPDLPLDAAVDVRFRDGDEQSGYDVGFWFGLRPEDSNWLHGSEAPDAEIIAYRVAK